MKLSLWPAAGVTAAAPVPLPAFGVGVLLFALLIAAAAPVAAFAPPARFEEAKVLARNAVYHDRNEVGTFYCGCRWTWRGRSGGVIDHASCGYRVRANAERAARMQLSLDAMRALALHDWPGNIRELDRCLETALALTQDTTVELAHLPEAVRVPAAALEPEQRAHRDDLVALLVRHKGNISAVARELGKARMQIHRWLERYGIDPSTYRT